MLAFSYFWVHPIEEEEAKTSLFHNLETNVITYLSLLIGCDIPEDSGLRWYL